MKHILSRPKNTAQLTPWSVASDDRELLKFNAQKIKTYQLEIKQCQVELASLQKEQRRTNRWYKQFEKTLASLDKLLKPYADPHLKQDKKREQLILELTAKIAIQQRLIQEKAAAIAQSLGKKKRPTLTVTRRSVDKLHQLQLELQVLQMSLAVLKGEKILLDKALNPVFSLNKAAFILPKHQKMIREKGVMYLVDANKTGALTKSEKAAGRIALMKAKTELVDLRALMMKNQIGYQKGTAKHEQDLMDKIADLEAKKEALTKETPSKAESEAGDAKEAINAISKALVTMYQNPKQALSKAKPIKKYFTQVFGKTGEAKVFLDQLDGLSTAPEISGEQIMALQKLFDKIVVNPVKISNEEPESNLNDQLSKDENRFT